MLDAYATDDEIRAAGAVVLVDVATRWMMTLRVPSEARAKSGEALPDHPVVVEIDSSATGVVKAWFDRMDRLGIVSTP